MTSYFKSDELEHVLCTAIMWQDDVVLDILEYGNICLLVPFIREHLTNATKLEQLDNRGNNFGTARGRAGIEEVLRPAVAALNYHTASRNETEEQVLEWLRGRDHGKTGN